MKPILLAAPALLLCAASAQTDPDTPIPGAWDVTSTMIDVSGPGITPEAAAEMLKGRSPRVEHYCFSHVVPRVGDTKADGHCTVTRVSDSGRTVDREWQCPAKDGNPLVIVKITGERSPERYSQHSSWTRYDDGPDKPGRTIVYNEEARRMGDCTPGS